MAQRESAALAEIRWEKLRVLQSHYVNFRTFLHDAMEELGFSVTEIQADIADYLEFGPSYKMVQAQRGQAKSTITAIYAVWRLIHAPNLRVLILSAGGDLASDIARLCIRLIESMEVLECLRPDKNAGDQTANDGYDIHHSLKGIDKSASLACIGITGNLQGKRADLLIADDIESSKNSQTALMRERLMHLTRDFTSINREGDIIYLGTPQSIDSIYSSLPARGFAVRIWTGRYPSPAQRIKFGGYLAPIIAKRLDADPSLGTGGGTTGLDGKPIDPRIMSEEALVKKELDQGRSYFLLQHMLMTDLADEDKYPLKLRNAIFMPLSYTHASTAMVWMPAAQNLITLPMESGIAGTEVFSGQLMGDAAIMPYEAKIMFVDPAGGGANGDETGWAVLGFLAGYIYVLAAGGVKGGYDDAMMLQLANTAIMCKVDSVVIEPNFGHGAMKNVFLPVLRRQLALPENVGIQIGVEDSEYAQGRKEQRICDVLEPVINNHKLVFNQDLLQADVKSVSHYPMDKRKVYQLLFQIAHITRDVGSLLKDDRVDGLAGGVRYFADRLARDADLEAQRRAEKAELDWMKNPTGRPDRQHERSRLPPAITRLANKLTKRR
jgi:hypothetical protein